MHLINMLVYYVHKVYTLYYWKHVPFGYYPVHYPTRDLLRRFGMLNYYSNKLCHVKLSKLAKVSHILLKTLNRGNLKISRHEYAKALMIRVHNLLSWSFLLCPFKGKYSGQAYKDLQMVNGKNKSCCKWSLKQLYPCTVASMNFIYLQALSSALAALLRYSLRPSGL